MSTRRAACATAAANSAGPTPRARANFAGGPPGDLDAGAPRWKQRAFYDAMKDTAIAASLELSMARVSIYDTVNGELVDDILEGRAVVEPAAILQIVEQRTAAERPIRPRTRAPTGASESTPMRAAPVMDTVPPRTFALLPANCGV